MINANILLPEKDPMGYAIYEYYTSGKAHKLRVLSSMFDEDEIPVEYLFRTEKNMPFLEKKALKLANGKILDVGAGSGCHSVVLQEKGFDVHAIDISPWSVNVMEQRGIKKFSQTNIFDNNFSGQYDTIMFLMNGSGIIGKIENMDFFFKRMNQLLAPNGCIIMDSSDLIYLYENEDGSIDINLAGNYYGEVDFKMIYKDMQGDSFDWLYIDFDNLVSCATRNGFNAKMIAKGKHNDYLAMITRQ